MTNSTSQDKITQNYERIQLIKARLKNQVTESVLKQAVARQLPEW